MVLDPGTAYTNARKAKQAETQQVMDMLTWRQMGEMRAQQMRLADQDQQAQQQTRFLERVQQLAGIFKETDPAKREYMIKQAARQFGIDPASPFVKDTVKMYKAASDETLRRAANVTAAIGAEFADDPVRGEQLIKGYMAGQMPEADLLKALEQKREQNRRTRTMAGQPSVGQSINLPIATDRIANPAAIQSATKAGTAAIMAPATRPSQDAAMTFAPQARGGIKGATGMDPGPMGSAQPTSPLTAATDARNTVQSAGVMSADRMMFDPTSAGSMGEMLAPPAPSSDVRSYMDKVAQRESSGRANARNKNSTAVGLFQPLKTTWRGWVRDYKPEWAEGMSEEQIDQMRLNPAAQNELMERAVYDDIAKLERNGIPPTGGNLYAMHHFGQSGAGRLFGADPDDSVASVMPRSVIAANGYLKKHTVGSLLRSFELRFGNKPLTGDQGVQLVRSTQEQGTASQQASLGKQPQDLDQPTPAKTENIDPQTGSAVTQPSQNRDNPADDRISGLIRLRDQELQLGNKPLVDSLNATIDQERKATQDLKIARDEKSVARSDALDRYSRIGEQRERIADLVSNPALPAMTGLGGREVSVPIPLTGTSVGVSISDISSTLGQALDLLGLPGGKQGANLAAAKSTWKAIQSSGLLDELQRLKGQSSTGATGFGSLTEGERNNIIDAYLGVDDTAPPPKFIQALTRLDDRLKSAEDRIKSDYKAKYGEELNPPVPETVKRGQEAINKANEAAAKKSLEEQIAASSPEQRGLIEQFLQFLTQNRMGTEVMR